MKPDNLNPAHCTGLESLVALSKELPEAFTLNTAGTKYTVGA
jgi:metal-dependent hydrolase (beta-lactamase superfamily II)